MSKTNNKKPITAKETPEDELGNIEIAIESVSQEQLDQLLDFVVEKVEDMGLVMVGRTYFSKEGDIEQESKNTKETTESTQKR